MAGEAEELKARNVQKYREAMKESIGKAAARKLQKVVQSLEEAAGLVEAHGDMWAGIRALRGAREDLAKIEQMILV